MKVKKIIPVILIVLGIVCIVIGSANMSFASHAHTGEVSIKSVTEHNGYIQIKWNKSSKCKGYCVHLNCGSKALYAKCVGKTISNLKIKRTVTLGKKLDKCGNWKAIVYCSPKGPSGANGGRGG